MTKYKPCVGNLTLKGGWYIWSWLVRLSHLPHYIEVGLSDAIARENRMAKRLSCRK